MDAEPRYTVSEITRLIKTTLEDSFYSVLIQGEISDFKRHSSGHFYFTLKDQHAQLSAVMWRGKNMRLYFTPQDGMKVLAKGRITVFEKSGRYQLDVDTLQPLGIGELQIAFEQLKARLRDEGLFDESRKKPVPVFPETVGIVTSPTGAAIRDIVSIINRRFPGVQLILRPVKVQAEGAAEEIAQAIDEFNEYGAVDVLIVGRGGGSLEDLWPFNEESTARAISRSKIPVISAVGHEIDFTIADFVADLRAPTPSAAAELVVPDAAQEWEKIIQRLRRLYRITTDKFNFLNEKIQLLKSSRALQMPLDLIKQSSLQLDMLSGKLEMSYQNHIKNRIEYLNQLENRINALNPEAVLKRGFSITYRSKDNTIVKESSQLTSGDGVILKFFKGEASGRIEQVN
ncbi:hypothetical protein AMJ80_11305 [bacterium SM23_31]|nr:MAG: hypothetical protein AMJ80_11305 [bacterium SM23_31]